MPKHLLDKYWRLNKLGRSDFRFFCWNSSNRCEILPSVTPTYKLCPGAGVHTHPGSLYVPDQWFVEHALLLPGHWGASPLNLMLHIRLRYLGWKWVTQASGEMKVEVDCRQGLVTLSLTWWKTGSPATLSMTPPGNRDPFLCKGGRGHRTTYFWHPCLYFLCPQNPFSAADFYFYCRGKRECFHFHFHFSAANCLRGKLLLLQGQKRVLCRVRFQLLPARLGEILCEIIFWWHLM